MLLTSGRVFVRFGLVSDDVNLCKGAEVCSQGYGPSSRDQGECYYKVTTPYG